MAPRVCVRVCACACVCACVRVRVCVCVCNYVPGMPSRSSPNPEHINLVEVEEVSDFLSTSTHWLVEGKVGVSP